MKTATLTIEYDDVTKTLEVFGQNFEKTYYGDKALAIFQILIGNEKEGIAKLKGE